MTFDRDTFHDYVASHGFGVPTQEAYELAEKLFVRNPDYADLGHEVVARGLTTDFEGEKPNKLVVTAAQLRPLVIMLATAPEEVGELDNPQTHADFRTELLRTMARFAPKAMLDATATEVLADMGEGSLFHETDSLDELAGVVCGFCGGTVQEVLEHNDMPMVIIRANDSVSDPENILSSNAWAYANRQPRNPGERDCTQDIEP